MTPHLEFPCIVYSIILILVFATSPTLAYIAELRKCEPIRIPRCRTMPYDMTLMPNLAHHNSQDNAVLVFEKFDFILDRRCSDVLLFLLCSIYVPICPLSFQPHSIPPCRSVCEKARRGCEPLLRSYNASWPEVMECTRFPEYARGVCITPAAFVKPKSKRGCGRCKKKRPSLKNFMRYKYNYAFHFVVHKRKRLDQSLIAYKGTILHVIFSEIKRELVQPSEVTIYSNSSRCACAHKLRKGKDYVIMGHTSKDVTKLEINKQSAVDGWKRTWPTRIKKWHSRFKTRTLRQKHQKKFNKNRRKLDNHPNVRPHNNKGDKRQSNSLPITDYVNGYAHGGRYYPKSGNKNKKTGSH